MPINAALILVVDDEPMIVNALLRTLTMHDYTAFGTTDCEEAISLIKKRDFAVIISDQKMPLMTGLELLSKMQSVSRDTVRILMIAQREINTVISAIKSGQIHHYVEKPWNESSLIDVVRKALTLHGNMH